VDWEFLKLGNSYVPKFNLGHLYLGIFWGIIINTERSSNVTTIVGVPLLSHKVAIK
jgi:hypothetical protein